VLKATQIKWNEAHNVWSDFKLGDLYTQYLFDTYGIVVEAGGHVIWNHVITIEVIVPVMPGGAGEDFGYLGGKKKKAKKKIKLIFIMGDIREEQTKEVHELISPKIVSDIKNKIEEQLQTKISLSDVQIIKG